MYELDYRRAEDLDAVTKRPPNMELLAGGQGLLPELKARVRRVSSLLDIKSLLPSTIAVSSDQVMIGAGATHADIATDPELRKAIPALAALAANVGDPSVRNRGTLGGALAQNHLSSDWSAAALALDASLETDLRQIRFSNYVEELREGAAPRDLILRVTFQRPARAAYVKLLHPAQRFPIAGSFIADHGDQYRIGLTGLSETGVFRWFAAEDALNNKGALPATASTDQPRGDHIASADFRMQVAAALTSIAFGRIDTGSSGPVSIVHGKPL